MNFLRITFLSVLLAASVAVAQSKKAQKPTTPPKPPITEADKPKTCDDQCDLIDKVCADPCKKGAGNNKGAQKACEDSCKQMVSVCRGSCRDKGRLDKQYMMERLKPPGGVQIPKEGEGEGGHADEH